MRTAPVLLAIASALVLGAAPAGAQTFNLTGHWTGKWSCKGFSAPFDPGNGKLVNKFTASSKDNNSIGGISTLDITQSGPTFAAVIDAGESGGFSYNAVAVPAVKDPSNNGNVILLGCHLANTLPGSDDAELVQASVKTKTGDVKASFKATSIFADNFPESGICKYTYKRIDTNDPGVSACP